MIGEIPELFCTLTPLHFFYVCVFYLSFFLSLPLVFSFYVYCYLSSLLLCYILFCLPRIIRIFISLVLSSLLFLSLSPSLSLSLSLSFSLSLSLLPLSVSLSPYFSFILNLSCLPYNSLSVREQVWIFEN